MFALLYSPIGYLFSKFFSIGFIPFYILLGSSVLFGFWRMSKLTLRRIGSLGPAYCLFCWTFNNNRIGSWFSDSAVGFGLDTHQHIYWINKNSRIKYIPFNIDSTDIIENYPRGLHNIGSIWSGISNQPIAGISLKFPSAFHNILRC